MPPPYQRPGIYFNPKYQTRDPNLVPRQVGIQHAQNGYGNFEGTGSSPVPALSGYAHEAPHNTYASSSASPLQVDQHFNSGKIGLPGQSLPGPGPNFMAQAQAEPSHQAFLAKANSFKTDLPTPGAQTASQIKGPTPGIQTGLAQARTSVADPDMQGISLNQPANSPGQSAPGQAGPAHVFGDGSKSFIGSFSGSEDSGQPAEQSLMNRRLPAPVSFTGVAPTGPVARRIAARKAGPAQSGPGNMAQSARNSPEWQASFHGINSLFGGRGMSPAAIASMADQHHAAGLREQELQSAQVAHLKADAAHLGNQAAFTPMLAMMHDILKQGWTAEQAKAALAGIGMGGMTAPSAPPTPMAGGIGVPLSPSPVSPASSNPNIGTASSAPAAWLGQNNSAAGALVNPESGNTAASAFHGAMGMPGLNDPSNPDAHAFARSMESLPGGLDPIPTTELPLHNFFGLVNPNAGADQQTQAIDYYNKITGKSRPRQAPRARGILSTAEGRDDPMRTMPGALQTGLFGGSFDPMGYIDPNAASSADFLRKTMPKGKAHPLF